MELDQVDEDRPLNLEQEVLLVLLELGVQAVDDALSRRLGADLALEAGLEDGDALLDQATQLADRRDDASGRFRPWVVPRPLGT